MSAIANAISNGVTGAVQTGASIYNTTQTNKTNKEIANATNQANLEMTEKYNQTNKDIAQMNNEYNQQMLERQIEEQWDMWNAENEYNSASSQRDRLESAGLNPYLMMDGGNAGTASSMTAPAGAPAAEIPQQAGHVEPYKIDKIDFSGFSNFRDIVRGFFETKSLEEDVTSKQLGNAKLEKENALLQTQLDFAERNLQADLDNKLQDYYNKKSAKSGIDLDNNWKSSRNLWDPMKWSSELRMVNTQRELAATQAQGQMLANLTSLEWYRVLPQQIRNKLTSELVDINNKRLSGKLTEAQTQKVINESITEFYNAAYKDSQAQGQIQENEFARQRHYPTLGKLRSDCVRAMYNRYGDLDNPLSLPGTFIKSLGHAAEKYTSDYDYYQGY